MVVPQCGRCGGFGGPHTCLRDCHNLTYVRDPALADELEAANAKLAQLRQLVITNDCPARLYKMLQIIDGE